MVTLFAIRIHMLNPWQSGAPIPSISCSDIGPSIPPERKRSIEEIETLERRTRKRDVTLSNIGRKRFAGGILWRSNPLALREIRVVDRICDLPSSPKGAIKVHEICHNPCVAVRKIVFAL